VKRCTHRYTVVVDFDTAFEQEFCDQQDDQGLCVTGRARPCAEPAAPTPPDPDREL
jgi:hypothetical protein